MMKNKFIISTIVFSMMGLTMPCFSFGEEAPPSLPVAETQTSKDNAAIVTPPHLQLISTAFDNKKAIPDKYTCKGADFSPPLTINNVPKGTLSLALTIHDPEGIIGTWVHWVVFNLPPDLREIPERSTLGVQALNDFGNFYYGGPCLADQKEHRLVFTLYALNTFLSDLTEGATKETLDQAMKGKVIEQAELIGTYQNANWK